MIKTFSLPKPLKIDKFKSFCTFSLLAFNIESIFHVNHHVQDMHNSLLQWSLFATVPESSINSCTSWFIFNINTNQYYESVFLDTGIATQCMNT
jgi:hypothetical protein